MYTSIKYLYIGILFSYLATVVIQFFIITFSCTAYKYYKYKQYTHKGRLTGECCRSVYMISTSNLH